MPKIANLKAVNEAVANAQRHFPELLGSYRTNHLFDHRHPNTNSTIFLRSKISMDAIAVMPDVMLILDTIMSAARNPFNDVLEKMIEAGQGAVVCALKLLIYAQVHSAKLYEADEQETAAADIALIPSAISHGLRKAEDLFQQLPAQDIKTVMSRMKNVIKVTVDYKFQDAIRDLVIAMRITELILDQLSNGLEIKTSLLGEFAAQE